MCPKAQHAKRYKMIPILLKKLREDADLTQRQLGKKLSRPQSWVYNCETANRRVDIGEFIDGELTDADDDQVSLWLMPFVRRCVSAIVW